MDSLNLIRILTFDKMDTNKEEVLEQVNLTTEFEVKKMKERGRLVKSLVILNNFFTPLVKDLEKISGFIEDCKTVVDIGSGYGILINKLARENPKIRCLGIDTVYWEGNSFPIPESRNNLDFEFNGIEAMCHYKRFGVKKRKFDCVICSWMPQGSDWRKMMSKLSNRKVILILSQDFVTGVTATYGGMSQFGFELEGKAWKSGDSLIQLWKKNG